MFRYLQNGTNKPVNAMFSTDVDFVYGMGAVVKNDVVTFPTAATTKDIFIVTKDRIPTGLDTAIGEIPDYSDIFENIPAGVKVALVKPTIGERFFDDQLDLATLAVDDYVVVGTDGKFAKASTGDESNLQVKSVTYKDCGKHAGAIIEVVDWATV